MCAAIEDANPDPERRIRALQRALLAEMADADKMRDATPPAAPAWRNTASAPLGELVRVQECTEPGQPEKIGRKRVAGTADHPVIEWADQEGRPLFPSAWAPLVGA